MDKTIATKMAAPYPLLTPKGLPERFLSSDQHVLLFQAGYTFDIRILAFKVNQLSQFAVYLPFVDRLENGKTAFMRNIIDYQGQLVPALVGTLGTGTDIQLAMFDPPHAVSVQRNSLSHHNLHLTPIVR